MYKINELYKFKFFLLTLFYYINIINIIKITIIEIFLILIVDFKKLLN